MKMFVKKGDKVKVIAGKDKGKEGEVIRVIPETQRVVVEKVNLVKKHQRPSQKNPNGGIATVEAPIHASNVMIVCPSCKKPARFGSVRNEAGKKVRVCKKCGKTL